VPDILIDLVCYPAKSIEALEETTLILRFMCSLFATSVRTTYCRSPNRYQRIHKFNVTTILSLSTVITDRINFRNVHIMTRNIAHSFCDSAHLHVNSSIYFKSLFSPDVNVVVSFAIC